MNTIFVRYRKGKTVFAECFETIVINFPTKYLNLLYFLSPGLNTPISGNYNKYFKPIARVSDYELFKGLK